MPVVLRASSFSIRILLCILRVFRLRLETVKVDLTFRTKADPGVEPSPDVDELFWAGATFLPPVKPGNVFESEAADFSQDEARAKSLKVIAWVTVSCAPAGGRLLPAQYLGFPFQEKR